MKTPPLTFTQDNFSAVIQVTKTETRRLSNSLSNGKPKYSVGDRCYLTEPTQIDTIFAHVAEVDHRWFKSEKVSHKITEDDLIKIKSRKAGTYKETIARFMLKSFARYWVEIVDVKLERLLDITAEAAIAEGIKYIKHPELACPVYFDYVRGEYIHADPCESYLSEIAAIHKPTKDKIGGWDLVKSNPWVWVYQFKRVTNND